MFYYRGKQFYILLDWMQLQNTKQETFDVENTFFFIINIETGVFSRDSNLTSTKVCLSLSVGL